jgi:hypothetical protein
MERRLTSPAGRTASFLLLALLSGSRLFGQQPADPQSVPQSALPPTASQPAPVPLSSPAPAASDPSPSPAPTPAPLAGAPPEPEAQGPASREATPDSTGAVDQGGSDSPTLLERFLSLDVFFPEGEIDLRLSRMVNKTFFEGLIRYNVVSGNILAFLRYRYYGHNHTTQFAVFDQIQLQRLQSLSNEFDRTRGFLMFMEWPHSYDYRTFLLTEVDKISTNREDSLITNNAIDTFIRLGLQLGSPGDQRSEAIVGESLARTPALFTATREIGPNDFSFTTALSYGFPYLGGDFNYLRLEFEALQRLDLTDRSFFVGRLHGGSFPFHGEGSPDDPIATDRFRIPLSAYFNLGGIDDMKGVSDTLLGTEELYSTWEFFTPWFLGENRHFLQMDWQNFYWVAYAGVGTIGFDRKVYTQFNQYIPDTGLGFESSARAGKYRFFISGIVARALKAGAGKLEARLSIRSYR